MACKSNLASLNLIFFSIFFIQFIFLTIFLFIFPQIFQEPNIVERRKKNEIKEKRKKKTKRFMLYLVLGKFEGGYNEK